MRVLSILRGVCFLLAVVLAGLAVSAAMWGGDDDVVWALFLTGVVLWGVSGFVGVGTRRAGRAA